MVHLRNKLLFAFNKVEECPRFWRSCATEGHLACFFFFFFGSFLEKLKCNLCAEQLTAEGNPLFTD